VSEMVCDPNAGWHGKGWIWSRCRGDEEACLSVELLMVGVGYAYVGTDRSWEGRQGAYINVGEPLEYLEGNRLWQIHCDGAVESMQEANIRICYEDIPDQPPDPEPDTPGGYELPLYGSTSVFGWTFTNTRLICGTAQAVIRPEGLASKTLVVGGAGAMWAVGSILLPGSIVTTSVIMGGIFVSLRHIDAACTEATVDIFESTWTETDHDDLVEKIVDEVGSSGTGEFTDEEIENAATKAEVVVSNSSEEKERQRKVANGEMTAEEADEEREEQIEEETYRILYEENFSLDIPCVVMAGDVDVSGHAPKQNTDIQIVAVRKFLGFDYLASDMVLATPRAGDDYNYD